MHAQVTIVDKVDTYTFGPIYRPRPGLHPAVKEINQVVTNVRVKIKSLVRAGISIWIDYNDSRALIFEKLGYLEEEYFNTRQDVKFYFTHHMNVDSILWTTVITKNHVSAECNVWDLIYLHFSHLLWWKIRAIHLLVRFFAPLPSNSDTTQTIWSSMAIHGVPTTTWKRANPDLLCICSCGLPREWVKYTNWLPSMDTGKHLLSLWCFDNLI